MDKLKINFDNKIKELKDRAEANKGLEFINFWVKVSHVAPRGGYIKQIGARAFGVFIVIRSYMSKDYIAFPSLSTIAYLSGCSITTTQKEIATLIKYGWIKKIGRAKNPQGRFGNTEYLIVQTDVVRGTGDVSFMKQTPLLLSTDGE